jgi:hypothetical protein
LIVKERSRTEKSSLRRAGEHKDSHLEQGEEQSRVEQSRADQSRAEQKRALPVGGTPSHMNKAERGLYIRQLVWRKQAVPLEEQSRAEQSRAEQSRGGGEEG